jgi:hypothetical protein
MSSTLWKVVRAIHCARSTQSGQHARLFTLADDFGQCAIAQAEIINLTYSVANQHFRVTAPTHCTTFQNPLSYISTRLEGFDLILPAFAITSVVHHFSSVTMLSPHNTVNFTHTPPQLLQNPSWSGIASCREQMYESFNLQRFHLPSAQNYGEHQAATICTGKR